MELPEIRYARSGDVAIAYQAFGADGLDLVFVPFFGNLRWAWEQPLFARFFEQLASFSRLILLDKRGTGLSDRPRVLTLETQMDDIRAVLDTVGSKRATLLGRCPGKPTVRTLRCHVSRAHAGTCSLQPACRSGGRADGAAIGRRGTRALGHTRARRRIREGGLSFACGRSGLPVIVGIRVQVL